MKNDYEHEQTKFDQLRPILASVSDKPSPLLTSPTSSLSNTTPDILVDNSSISLTSDDTYSSDVSDYMPGVPIPTISVLVHSSSRPTLTDNVQDCFASSNPLRYFWIQTVYEQFDKNASYRVFTRPIPKLLIASDQIILRSVLAPTVEPTDLPSLWKLNIHHCVNGKLLW